MIPRIPGGCAIWSSEQVRAAEARYFETRGTPAELMERAGAQVARVAARFALGHRILILAGTGNNGGDAYVVARLLRDGGHDVTLASPDEPTTETARAMRALWPGAVEPLTAATIRAHRGSMVIDGLFGIGLSRPIEDGLRDLLAEACAAASFALAIDLPSGVDCDSGADLGAAQMDATVTFEALRPAHLIGPAASKSGHVFVETIGIEDRVDPCGGWRSSHRPIIAPPTRDSHKYTRGMVVVVGGAMPGAARLAARAALHSGAGYVVIAGGDGGGPDALVHRDAADADALSKILDDDRIGAVLVGPGLGLDDRAGAMLDAAIASGRPLVIDGDALRLVAERNLAGRLAALGRAPVLTPHGGEFVRLFGEPVDGKMIATARAAKRIHAVIVHKGAETAIAAPDGGGIVCPDGVGWLSTAGTGDVLAGVIAARIADGSRSPIEAAQDAVGLHGRAAQLAGAAFAADDLIAELPKAIEQWSS